LLESPKRKGLESLREERRREIRGSNEIWRGERGRRIPKRLFNLLKETLDGGVDSS
jgi:hypothetical protein